MPPLSNTGTHALRIDGYLWYLAAERIIVTVVRVREFGQLRVAHGSAQPLDIGRMARPERSRPPRHETCGWNPAHIGVADQRRIARRVERNVGGKCDLRVLPRLVERLRIAQSVVWPAREKPMSTMRERSIRGCAESVA